MALASEARLIAKYFGGLGNKAMIMGLRGTASKAARSPKLPVTDAEGFASEQAVRILFGHFQTQTVRQGLKPSAAQKATKPAHNPA